MESARDAIATDRVAASTAASAAASSSSESCSWSCIARSSARCRFSTASGDALEGSSTLTVTTYRGVTRDEGVGDSEGLPLGVAPLGMGVAEGVGVLVGEAGREGESEGYLE